MISPGPGTPSRAGRILDLIRLDEHIPLLGVCLGHQALGEAFGARIVRGAEPVHGKVTEVRHAGAGLFDGCPTPMQTARYHSLVVERASLPDVFRVDAETGDGVIMAIAHRERPLFGIQFHPESYGTVGGDRIVTNFLIGVRASRPQPPDPSSGGTPPSGETPDRHGRDARTPGEDR